MNTFLFLFILTLCFSAFFWWAFRVLPGEKWQILASIPLFKKSNDQWEGLNLTYYGFLLASAGTLAGCAFIFLMKSLGIATPVLASLFLTLFFLCGIAARAVAYLVEKKKNTFTVGGAAFTGILIMPILVVGINFYSSYAIPLIPVLAALTISYAFGEGIGRIACISFGCCYGKPLSEMKPMTRRFFRKVAFVFEGKTKKIAYASGLDGQHMFPIQGLTALVYVVTGLVGLYLFLESNFTGSLLVTALMTQGWRAYSEVLRSDYRGDQKISVYQIMALVGMVYVVGLCVWYRVPAPVSLDLGAGLQAIWNPATILGLQAIWLLLFLYTGTSKVTGSHLQFHVKKEHI